MIEYLEQQEYWKRNNGWDHVFICQDPNALYKVVDKVKNGVLLVSDFGRLSRDQASLVKDVILPYSHRINPYQGDIGILNRNTLLFFMGNRYRKEVAIAASHIFLLILLALMIWYHAYILIVLLVLAILRLGREPSKLIAMADMCIRYRILNIVMSYN